jgi:hypothetical protein
MYGSNLYFKTPLHTLISMLGFANGNYGSNYGKLTTTAAEREAKRIKRKNRKQAQKRNRRR